MSCMKKDITSVTVQYNMSSEVNLFKGSYVVHFLDKDDVYYNFPISENEINEVKKTYNNQNISNYEKELLIVDDKPLIMPTSDIEYIISFSNGNKQVFIIRTDFRKNPLDKEKYKNLKVFIDKINNIIKSKEEIKKADKSHALYF
jgi:hypothetical protein